MAADKGATLPASQIATRRHERRSKAEERDSPSSAQWEAILDAAARVFHRVGYSSANLDDIAQEVGLNRSSIYYYVSGKAELLSELGRRTISENVDALTVVVNRGLPPAEMLHAIVRQQMELLQNTYPRLFVFHNERRHTSPELNQLIESAAELRVASMAKAIQSGIDQELFRSDLEPRMTARLIIGMCAETRYWWRPDGERSLIEIGDDVIRLVLSGILVNSGT